MNHLACKFSGVTQCLTMQLLLDWVGNCLRLDRTGVHDHAINW